MVRDSTKIVQPDPLSLKTLLIPVLLKWLYYRSEAINKHVWLRITRMEMASNVKTLTDLALAAKIMKIVNGNLASFSLSKLI